MLILLLQSNLKQIQKRKKIEQESEDKEESDENKKPRFQANRKGVMVEA